MKKLKILMCPAGSDGDTYPMLYFAKALKARGHQVTFAAPRYIQKNVEALGIPFIEASLNVKEWVSGKNIWETNLSSMKLGFDFLKQDIKKQFEVLIEQGNHYDLAFSGGYQMALASVAEARGITYRHIFHLPNVFNTNQYPPLMFPFQNLPPIGNQLAWKVFLLVQNLMLKKIINHYRTILSLPLINNVWSYYNQRSIMGLSKDLVPIPQPYQKSTIQVNYFYADHTEPLPDSLEAFIHQYGPPVYIGFGSMVNKDQNELEAIIHAIVNELKLPVILSKGWANFKLSQNNEKVYIASRVNHLKLFPKVLLAIHHGGPGTLSTVLKAGVPQILVPHMFDQFYWGQRLYELGLTTRPLNRSKLKKDAVIGSIRKTLNNTQIKKNIIEYKQKFMNANGIDELIDQQLLNIDGINL